MKDSITSLENCMNSDLLKLRRERQLCSSELQQALENVDVLALALADMCLLLVTRWICLKPW